MKRRFLSLLLALGLLCSLLPAALAQEEPPTVSALCVAQSGESVFLDVEEFQLLCRQATGSELQSVTFSPLAPAVGKLTCEEKWDTDDPDVPPNTYYTYRSPQLSRVCFTPYLYHSSRFTGQEELPFTMINRRDETVSGVLVLCVPEEPEESADSSGLDRTATVSGGSPILLAEYLPSQIRRRVPSPPSEGSWSSGNGGIYVDSALTSLSFTTLPSSDQGSLWLDYGGSKARKVLPGEPLFRDRDPYFFDVTLVPATRDAAEICLAFSASCNGAANVPGRLTLNLRSAKPAGIPSPRPTFPGDVQEEPDHSPEPPAESRFQDLSGWAWAGQAVRFLEELRAVPYDQNDPNFRPGETATRMELIYALVLTAYPTPYRSATAPTPSFTDLPADKALATAAAVAAQRGLVLGDGENRLLPGEPITRQDALVILHRAMADRGQLLPPAGDLSVFSDVEDLAPYAREAAGVLFARGVLQGDGAERLDPLSPITRAEMACLLYRAFEGRV